MKKLVTFFIALVIVLSSMSFQVFALDTTKPGTFFSNEQVAKAEEIKDKYGIDAIFLYTQKSENKFNSLEDFINDFLQKNNITEKYFVFAADEQYYYYLWSSDLDGIFHSVDGSYIAKCISGEEFSPSKAEDSFYDLLLKMLENRTNCPYKYIKDQAGVLTDSQEKEINDKLTAFKENNKLDLVVVLTNGIDNGEYYYDDRMAFADDYYDYNGYSKDGALLLVNIGASDVYTRGNSWISTSGKCIGLLEDEISNIGSKLTFKLENGSFYEASMAFPDIIGDFIKSNKRTQYGIIGLITLVISLIGAFAYTKTLKNQLKSVKDATDANDYIVNNSLNVVRSYDHFLYSHVTKTARESSSGGSSHTSSSGSSHGGGGF